MATVPPVCGGTSGSVNSLWPSPCPCWRGGRAKSKQSCQFRRAQARKQSPCKTAHEEPAGSERLNKRSRLSWNFCRRLQKSEIHSVIQVLAARGKKYVCRAASPALYGIAAVAFGLLPLRHGPGVVEPGGEEGQGVVSAEGPVAVEAGHVPDLFQVVPQARRRGARRHALCGGGRGSPQPAGGSTFRRGTTAAGRRRPFG